VAVRGVTLNLGRDEETAPGVEQRNYARCQTFLQNSPDATALYKLTSQIRYRGPRSDSEHALVASEARARRQHDDILRTLHSYFRGTPPSFEDAVRTVVMSDADGQLYDLPPQAWIKDQVAWMMLASGRTLGEVTHRAGVILIPEAAFHSGAEAQGAKDPGPLARTIQASEALPPRNAAAASPQGSAVKRKPGPKSIVRRNATAKMLEDLRSGTFTVPDLRTWKLDALKAQYGPGSLNTIRAARDEAIAEFQSSNSENSSRKL